MVVTKKSLPKVKKGKHKTKNKIQNKIKKKMKKKILSKKRKYIRKNKSKRKGRKNNLSKNQMIQKGGYMVRNLCLLNNDKLAKKILENEIKKIFPQRQTGESQTNNALTTVDKKEKLAQKFLKTFFIPDDFQIMDDIDFLSFDINDKIYEYIRKTKINNLIEEDLMDYVLSKYFTANYGNIKLGNLNSTYRNIILDLLEINYYLNLELNSLGYDIYCPSGLKGTKFENMGEYSNLDELKITLKKAAEDDEEKAEDDEEIDKIITYLKNNKSVNVHKIFLFTNYLDYIVFILENSPKKLAETTSSTIRDEFTRIRNRFLNTRTNIKAVIPKENHFDFDKYFENIEKGIEQTVVVVGETGSDEIKTQYRNKYQKLYENNYHVKETPETSGEEEEEVEGEEEEEEEEEEEVEGDEEVVNNEELIELLYFYREILTNIFFNMSDTDKDTDESPQDGGATALNERNKYINKYNRNIKKIKSIKNIKKRRSREQRTLIENFKIFHSDKIQQLLVDEWIVNNKPSLNKIKNDIKNIINTYEEHEDKELVKLLISSYISQTYKSVSKNLSPPSKNNLYKKILFNLGLGLFVAGALATGGFLLISLAFKASNIFLSIGYMFGALFMGSGVVIVDNEVIKSINQDIDEYDEKLDEYLKSNGKTFMERQKDALKPKKVNDKRILGFYQNDIKAILNAIEPSKEENAIEPSKEENAIEPSKKKKKKKKKKNKNQDPFAKSRMEFSRYNPETTPRTLPPN